MCIDSTQYHNYSACEMQSHKISMLLITIANRKRYCAFRHGIVVGGISRWKNSQYINIELEFPYAMRSPPSLCAVDIESGLWFWQFLITFRVCAHDFNYSETISRRMQAASVQQ